MTGWLLDTNVISEFDRSRPSAEVNRWIKHQPLTSLHVSIVTLAQIQFGIERKSDPLRRDQLRKWLNETVRLSFEGRVVGLSETILLRWMFLGADLQRRGATVPASDLLIAATASGLGLTLVTRNVKHFVACDVPILNAWTGESFNM